MTTLSLMYELPVNCVRVCFCVLEDGPLVRYLKLRVAHAPVMLESFSPPPRVSDPDMHHGMCAKHVSWFMPGSLTSGFLWSRWRGKRSRHSRRMRNPQFYVSGKRPMRRIVFLLYKTLLFMIDINENVHWFKPQSPIFTLHALYGFVISYISLLKPRTTCVFLWFLITGSLLNHIQTDIIRFHSHNRLYI